LKHPRHILEQYWGFSSFKPLQEEIISSVLNDVDTVALLPTGGGKSICFQLPALIKDGISIVVSPLVALITDQVQSLKDKGIKALSITGGITHQELSNLLDNAIYGNYKFLYLSPERLSQELVQNAIRHMNVNLFAIDEAHCISKWGNDFRPSYRNVNILRELHPLVSYIALTATATPEVLTDTISQLKLETPAVIKGSFFRENISFIVQKEEDKFIQITRDFKKKYWEKPLYMFEAESRQLNSVPI
jgi:Superfamily II DNA helicase